MSGGSARFIAMGGAGTALANDASSVEYNPAGLAYVRNINLTALALGEVNKEVVGWENGQPKYEYRFNFTPLYAALALSNLSFAYKKPFIPPVIVGRADGGYWTSYAPDTYPMKFDWFSDVTDTSKLDTFSVGTGTKFGPIALGANLTYIKGEVSRKVDGIWFGSGRFIPGSEYENDPYKTYTTWDSQFHSYDWASIDGFTVDLGAIINLALLKVGLVYRNAYSSINYTRDYMWHDDFVWGNPYIWGDQKGRWWTYDPASEIYSGIKLPSFFNLGVAVDLGAIKLVLDLDNFDVTHNFSQENWNKPERWRYGTLHAGVEFWVLPILALRAGAYGNIRLEELDPIRAAELAVRGITLSVGAGLSLLGFSLDVAVLGDQIQNVTPDLSHLKFIASGSAKF
ncbi:MAG: UPF0164 family protein [Dictyoglomus sp.]|nr:UPF0164 family protein [Dictyoglomus sp.]MDW8188023.1 UPF0164 family protein [Dictyoglomus sp.]